jgi:hypothetical protein
MNKFKTFLLFFVIITFFSSCIPLKMGGTQSRKKCYEEFYISDGVIQYFIKPLKFKSGNNEFYIDFTFRDTVNINSLITANYSFISEFPVKNIDSVIINTTCEKFLLQNGSKLFVDKNKKSYEIRYSDKIYYSELKKFFYSDNLHIFIYSNKNEYVFEPNKNTLKKIKISKDEVIDIIDLNK